MLFTDKFKCSHEPQLENDVSLSTSVVIISPLLSPYLQLSRERETENEVCSSS